MQHIQVAALDGTRAARRFGFETDAKDIDPVGSAATKKLKPLGDSYILYLV